MLLCSTSPALFRLHGELAAHSTSGTQQLDTRHCGLRLGTYAGRKLTMSGACGRMQGLYPTSDDSSGCLELPPSRLYILGAFRHNSINSKFDVVPGDATSGRT
jgi:hypothetical protein